MKKNYKRDANNKFVKILKFRPNKKREVIIFSYQRQKSFCFSPSKLQNYSLKNVSFLFCWCFFKNQNRQSFKFLTFAMIYIFKLKTVHFKMPSSVASIIFNTTSADFVLMSLDVILKMTIELSQLKIALFDLKMDRL